jgi:hypothetical protein
MIKRTNDREIASSSFEIGTLSLLARIRICVRDLGRQRGQPTAGRNRTVKLSGLFCRAQRRTEITEFVVDFVRSFDGLSNLFAEQRAIAFA